MPFPNATSDIAAATPAFSFPLQEQNGNNAFTTVICTAQA
jgi:hypothetical protein